MRYEILNDCSVPLKRQCSDGWMRLSRGHKVCFMYEKFFRPRPVRRCATLDQPLIQPPLKVPAYAICPNTVVSHSDAASGLHAFA